MINEALVAPKSIVVVGGSNDVRKPGGKLVKNIIEGGYKGELIVVNPREASVQGINCFSSVSELPNVDLAILVIPANSCLEAVRELANHKATTAFIIVSAGFGEAGKEGAFLEKEIVKVVDSVNGCLIGPNCIGVMNANYKGVFTTPIPELNQNGCDLISGSGATAVFIMEAGIPLGLKFSNVYSVGNGAQNNVEDILEYMDDHFDLERDALVKLLYLETIKDPQKLLKHASSLIRKGAKIAAIKAGSTELGSRAAASHTGAIANSDKMVRALFSKAGIVYCTGREELLSVASIFSYKPLRGKNIAIITHAGGSAVMLADALASGGLNVPPIEGEDADKLLNFLYPGSSVGNPIDFLATGTAEQLGIIIDYCEHKFDHIDAMVVVFGSPGLFDVENVYNVLSVKLDICKKPIYPVLPSVINAQREIKDFLNKGNVNFPDEVVLGKALSHVYDTLQHSDEINDLPKVDNIAIRETINQAGNGFLKPAENIALLKACGIPVVKEEEVATIDALKKYLQCIEFPLVMKVIGPVHKSDTGGVILNIRSEEEAVSAFKKIMQINDATGVLVQPMLSGEELYIGVKYEPGFGHVILFGLGGVFIEVFKDVKAILSPPSRKEIEILIKKLKGYIIFDGYRGKEPINEERFIDIILSVAALIDKAPEIVEMDINPLIASGNQINTVDVRILLEKK